jgi:hypothetical protein
MLKARTSYPGWLGQGMRTQPYHRRRPSFLSGFWLNEVAVAFPYLGRKA